MSSELRAAEHVLDGIARDFTFDPELKTPILGRTIGEIEASRKFPVRYVCPEQVAVTGHRLRQAGLDCEIIVLQRIKWGVRYSFILGLTIDGKKHEIHFDRGIRLTDATAGYSKYRVSRRVKFNLSPQQSLGSLFSGPGLYLRRSFRLLNPRELPLSRNTRKNHEKAERLGKALKLRLRRAK